MSSPAGTSRSTHPRSKRWLPAIHGWWSGGFGAVVSHVGSNPIAMYSSALLYGDPAFLTQLPVTEGEGTQVLIAEPDRWLGRYGNVTTFAQAFADLFCLLGWQAARFIEEIDPWKVATGQGRELVVA